MAMLSIWGILLVVLGHSGFEEPIIQQKLSGLHSWIYSFHMPLFFMISGYLFSLTNASFKDIDYGKFMFKKVKRLLVPYLVLGVITYLIKFTFSGLSHATRDFSLENFFKMFIVPSCDGSTIGYLWYVFTLFMVFAIVVALCQVHLNLKSPVCCSVMILIFWCVDDFMPNIEMLNLKTVVHDMPYFMMGILYKSTESAVNELINRGGVFNVVNPDSAEHLADCRFFADPAIYK